MEPQTLIDQYLSRIEDETAPDARAKLLRELAWLFENEVRDPARALTARLAAYREQPQRAAWSGLERLADAVDGWSELIGEVAASIPDLPVDDRAYGWVHLGGIYERRLEHPDAALGAYRRALALDADCAEARLRLEALLRARGEHAALATALEERAARAPALERRALHLELADIYAQLGEPAEAILRYEELRAETPGDLGLLRALERLYQEAGAVRDLLGVLEAQAGVIEGARDRAALHRRMAREWEEQLGDLDKAAGHLEWVLQFEPGAEEAYRALERIYGALGRWRAAVDVYARHAAVVGPARRAELNAAAARICEQKLSDAAGAIDCIRRIEADRPADVEVMSAPIRLYERTQDFDHLVDLLERRAARVDGAARAELFHRSGELVLDKLDDEDGAAARFARALEADPAHVPSLVALAEVHRRRGQLRSAARLLREATGATTQREERVRLIVREAELLQALDDVDGAAALWTGALELEPTHVGAATALVALLEEAGRLPQLRAPLELLAGSDPDGERRVAHWLRLGAIEEQLGGGERALAALDHALALARTLGLAAPATQALRARGAVALRLGRHAEAWAAFSEVADGAVGADEPAAVVELRWQLGTAALALGRHHDAQRWLEAALALDPAHRPSRRALLELDRDRPEALLGHHHALLAGAPLDEQAALWTAIADLYAGPLADRALAADAYRQALTLAPDDPRLLHKCLDACVALAAWSDTLPLLEQLIAGERVPKVRAKYAQAAGLILYDELHRTAEAERYLVAAVDEDATLERAAAALEEILSARADWTALANLSCVRLQRLGPAGSVAEKRVRARLWAQLGTLCAERLGDRDSAVAAFEVAARFDPADVHSHRQLAALYGEAKIERALAEQRLVVAAEPAAAEAYAALERLCARAGDHEAAAGCARARRLVEGGDLGDVTPAPLLRAAAALRPATWAQLAHSSEDGHVAALLALVTPAVVAAHAQPPRQHGLDKKERVDPNDPRAFARVLRYVARVLGVPAPDAYVRYEQPAPTQLVACLDGRRAVPTLVIGRPLLGHRRDERELIFHLAEALAYLRPGRLLGCLGAPAAQLAHLIDGAMALAGGATVTALAAPLRALLPPPLIEQAAGLGRALAERHVDGSEAALAWLRATELTAGRTALLLTGDLALCARLVGDATCGAVPAAERRIDLAAASVGSALAAARAELRLAPANGAATPLPPPLRITAV